MLRACLGLALGLALFSFAAAEGRYPDSAEATRSVTIVRVQWVADYAEADAVCSKLGNEEAKGTILACYHIPTGTIVAVQPSSFNDWQNLAILGHEFWHALGASHP